MASRTAPPRPAPLGGERGFAWLDAFKRLRTRYQHRADSHLALLQLACALICYRQLPPV